MADAPTISPGEKGVRPRRELKGDLGDVPLAVILQAVKERHLTGSLFFRRGADEVTVEVANGEVVFAHSTDPATRLGEWLLMRGAISVSQYEESVRRLRESGKRQGTILLEMGCIPPLELERAVRQQVADIIMDLFSWSTGEYRFSPKETSDEAITLDLSISEVIIKGIGRVRNWPLIQRGLQPFTEVLQINRAFDLTEARRVRLSREEDSVLQLVDGKRSIEQIAAASPFRAYATYRTLYAFKAAHVLVRAQPPGR